MAVLFGSGGLGGFAGLMLLAAVVAPSEFLDGESLLRTARVGALIGFIVGSFVGVPLTLTGMGLFVREWPRTWWGWTVSGFVGGAIVVLGVAGMMYFSRS